MNRIDCVNKDDRYNPYERITHIGGTRDSDGARFKVTQQEAIEGMQTKGWTFYVERPTGDRVEVDLARSQYGNLYIKTTADGDAPNNLLSLHECR
jgi:hypothetical protein